MQHSERKKYPVKSYRKWIARVPSAYRKYVLDEERSKKRIVESDRNCLAMLRHYRSLMAMAQEARKSLQFLLCSLHPCWCLAQRYQAIPVEQLSTDELAIPKPPVTNDVGTLNNNLLVCLLKYSNWSDNLRKSVKSVPMLKL